MPSRSRKGKNNGNTFVDDGDLPRAYKPIIIEKGKKFAAYDKNGKLIILGYDRKIVERYANDRVRKG
jgi:hypothetical protein|tara:strand:+ start:370 stop:570 length:201 start_codon:yes stop_codon:yes gene_type:complete